MCSHGSIQNRVMRSISGMFVDNNIDDFNVLRRKYVYSFNSMLRICQNNIILNIQIFRN